MDSSGLPARSLRAGCLALDRLLRRRFRRRDDLRPEIGRARRESILRRGRRRLFHALNARERPGDAVRAERAQGEPHWRRLSRLQLSIRKDCCRRRRRLRGQASADDTASADRTEFFTGLVRQNWDASARVRLGGLITPSILLYGTGGVALGSVDSAFSYSATTAYNEIGAGSIVHTTFGAGSWNDMRIGWTAGLGVEAAIAARWKVRAEYRFADLGHYSKTVPLTRTTTDAAIPNTGSSAAVANVNADFHTLRLGVAYVF